MAAQNVSEQHILFTVAGMSVDTLSVLANTFIASLPSNSVNGKMNFLVKDYYSWDGTNLAQITSTSQVETLDIWCYVTATFQQTIQQNIAALQAAFPSYVVSTYGVTTSFGN